MLEIVALSMQSGTGMTCPALCLCEALGGPLRGFTSWESLPFLRSAQAHRRYQGPKTGTKSLFAEFGRVNRCPHRRDAAPVGPRQSGHFPARASGPGGGPMVPAPPALPAPSEDGRPGQKIPGGLVILSNRRRRRTAAKSLPRIYAPAGRTREYNINSPFPRIFGPVKMTDRSGPYFALWVLCSS